MSDNDNTSNVVILDVESTVDLPLERILGDASAAQVEDCLIMGWLPDGEFYLASMSCDVGKHLVLMERARRLLIDRLCEG